MWKFNVSSANILEATLKIIQEVKVTNESAIQVANSFRLKTLKCSSAYRAGRLKEVFIDGLSLITGKESCIFWGLKIKAFLTKFVQCADALLDEQHGQIEKLQIVPRRVVTIEHSSYGAVTTAIV